MLETFETGDGRTLSYLRRGAGPLVVCVPGGPGMDPEAYFSAIDLPGFELLIFAPRGTAASNPPESPEGYRVGGYVEDLESLRRHLGVQELTLYGNSHGGMVALAAAEAVLGADATEAQRRHAYRALMAQYVAREGQRETAYLDRLCAAPMRWEAAPVMYEELLGGLDLLAEAHAARAPALVVAGELDVVVPAAAMRRLAGALPRAELLELPGVGHFPEVEAPAQFSAALSAFLGE